MKKASDIYVKKAAEIADRCLERGAEFEKEGPAVAIEWLREAGFLSVCLPREAGGEGFEIEAERMEPILLVLKELGRGFLPLGRIYEGHVNALRLVETFGTVAQRTGWQADALAGHFFGIWNTGAGPDDDLQVETREGQDFLKGAKVFASGSRWISRPIVSVKANTPDSRLLVIPLDEVSVEIQEDWWQPMGMAASVSHRVDFSGLEIDEKWWLGGLGIYAEQPWLSGGAIRFAAVQLGGAESIFDAVCNHLRWTGRTDHPFQQDRIARMALDLESGRQWLEAAARQAKEADNEPDKFMNFVGLTRTAIEEICLRTAERAQQCVGLQGMLKPHPLERLLRDLLTYLRQPNPDGARVEAGRFVLETEKRFGEIWNSENF